MKIKKKFLHLTRFTYPNGTEHFLESQLPIGYQKDNYGNYWIKIGESNTMFTCHLDTACKDFTKINHLISSDGRYVSADGTTILGADDKAGMTVILYMIEKNIPGLYYFFLGEEVGCLGSSYVSDKMEKEDLWKDLNINKCVSFDRRGTGSVITDQFYGTCCSDEFAKELCIQLNKGTGLVMKPDNTGVLTDSAQFMGIIPECTNISVGYYNEHTTSEIQDLEHLYKLCNAVTKVDWDNLPIKRDPNDFGYGYGHGYSSRSDWDDFEWYAGGTDFDTEFEEDPKDRSPKLGLTFTKDFYTFVSKNDERIMAYISKEWISHESTRIKNALEKNGYRPIQILWDGTSCWVLEKDDKVNQYIGNRSDLCDIISDFNTIPVAHLKYNISSGDEIFA